MRSSQTIVGTRLLLITGIWLLVCGPVPSWAQWQIRAVLDSMQVQVGSTVSLWVQVDMPHDKPEPQFQYHALDTMSKLAVLWIEQAQPQAAAGAMRWEQRVWLLAYDTGLQPIPVPDIQSDDSAWTPAPLLLMVVSPKLPPATDLAPIKDIVEEKKYWYERGVVWYLAGGLIAGGLLLLWRSRYRIRHMPIVPQEAQPHVVALEQLESLRKKELWKNHNKLYYTELTDILRWYISRRYGIPALSDTSAGILEDLTKCDIDASARIVLERILNLADLAKFAKAEPAATTGMQMLEEARTFVVQTTPLESLKVMRS